MLRQSESDNVGPQEHESHRDELEAVLNSEVFRRAPNQSRLLRYLCEREFLGEREPPKEHQIALEALGRSSDFDERSNSIVRVEVYRVRKKLKEYYQTEGSSHLLRICLEPGQYVPRFVQVSSPVLAEKIPDPEPVPQDHGPASPEGLVPVTEIPVALVRKKNRNYWLGVSVALILGLCIGGVLVASRRQPASKQQPAGSVSNRPDPPIPTTTGDEIRILAGYPRAMQMDRLGHIWSGDRYFSGGRAVEAPRRLLAREPDQSIFRYYRAGDFTYNIPLKQQPYEMRLYFAPSMEKWSVTDQSASSFHTFIGINGKNSEYPLDFAADGIGSSTADIRVLKDIFPDKDGKLHLHFLAVDEFSFVNAIELLPSARNRIRPIRITVRDSFYTDRFGHIWPPDRYYRGGRTVERHDPVSGADDPDLFSSERYGDFDYLIPLAPGTYAVTLGFAETWFGPSYPGLGGAGSRVFDVSANGTPLVRQLDVFKEAGGSGKILLKTFHGVQPDAKGRLRLTFTSLRNFAMINNILIEDESK